MDLGDLGGGLALPIDLGLGLLLASIDRADLCQSGLRALKGWRGQLVVWCHGLDGGVVQLAYKTRDMGRRGW